MKLLNPKYLFVCCSVFVINSGCSVQEPGKDNDEILEIAYSTYKMPDDFYREDLDGGSIYYNNTLSILPLGQRTSNSYQLCTDDKDIARDWSEATSQNSAYYRELVDETETEKYFQFKRVWDENPTDIILSRVHKKSYLDRSMYDFFNPGDIIGQYNKKPYKIEAVQELVEYLWFTENYNISGRKVLESSISLDQSHFICKLKEIKIAGGDWGIRDQIILFETYYFINRTDGKITISQSDLKTIEGRSN